MSDSGKISSSYRLVEAYLFGTCNLKCGYCWFAESGKVLDSSELARFRDLAVIDQITAFFNKRATGPEKWHLLVTGGEPLLMPNFPIFAEKLFAFGNRISCYTALLIDRNHPSFQCLLAHGKEQFGYIMASFHPEAELQEPAYWERIALLKQAGHNVIVRFVGHPKRLHLMERLARKCEDLDVCFYPTTLFSKNYPGAYQERERELLASYFTSLSQRFQLEGGIDTTATLCDAGSRLISVDFTSGKIWPCISVQEPVLGNIYEDRLELLPPAIRCPKAGMACNCDIHYQQDIVDGAGDSVLFKAVAAGYVSPLSEEEQRQRMAGSGLAFSGGPKGIGNVLDDQTLVYPKAVVKEQFEKNFGKGLVQTIQSAPAIPIPQEEAAPPALASGWGSKLRSYLGF